MGQHLCIDTHFLAIVIFIDLGMLFQIPILLKLLIGPFQLDTYIHIMEDLTNWPCYQNTHKIFSLALLGQLKKFGAKTQMFPIQILEPLIWCPIRNINMDTTLVQNSMGFIDCLDSILVAIVTA
jgi:hypothetical protein